MVDTVDTNVIMNGNNLYIVEITNVSDGTGETDVVKVDLSTLTGPDGVNAPTSLKLMYAEWSIAGFEDVLIEWDGTADTPLLVCTPTNGFRTWEREGGKTMDATGATGDILVTTNSGGTAEAAGDTYSIKLAFRKKL